MDFQAIINDIECLDYKFEIIKKENYSYLQGSYYEQDVDTGKWELQKTRKWLLSEHMVKSEVVQTALKCALTSMEHRTREHFKYQGELVFCPHFDVDEFVKLAKEKKLETRKDERTKS